MLSTMSMKRKGLLTSILLRVREVVRSDLNVLSSGEFGPMGFGAVSI